MSALSTFGQRQQSLLQSLLHNKNGLTVDEISTKLSISRNAVNQHLSSLERNGFIESGSMISTGGRPSKMYSLSSKGQELFPRHYDLFSNLLISWVKQKLSDNDFNSCLEDLGLLVANEFKSRIQKHSTFANKLNEVTLIMNELGYDAKVGEETPTQSEITASNCVFHKLAEDCNDICKIDLTLLSTLLDSKIDHQECMVKNGNCCRFKITNNKL
jgi:predicted ArsR family transcriptional regulator